MDNSRDKTAVFNRQLIAPNTNWREKISELQGLLEQIRPQLVAAEVELADWLAAISAFEFNVRSRLELLTRRLEKIELEIQNLRRQLRTLQEAWFWSDDFDGDGGPAANGSWDSAADEDTAASGAYRYRKIPAGRPPKSLSKEESSRLKRLYRQLARRFHPDFALDEDDRAYRTEVMTAVNAAYKLGDLERLEELATQPDHSRQTAYTDEQLAQALAAELRHCRRRLREIRQEMTRLEEHDSVRLMRRVQRAAAEGRDLLAEIAANIQAKISHKLAQRDVLEAEIEAFANGQPEFLGAAFADAMYDLGLEQVLEEDSAAAFAEWRDKNRDRLDWDDDVVNEEWRAVRKASQQRRRRR